MEGIKIVPRPPKKKIKIRREVFEDFDLRLKQRGKIPEKEVFPISVPKKSFQPKKIQELPRYPDRILQDQIRETDQESRKEIIREIPRRAPSVQSVLLAFGTICVAFFLVISVTRTYSNAQAAKDNAYSEALTANTHLQNALVHLEKSDFKKAQENFQKAEFSFVEAKKEINQIGVIPKQAVKLTPHYGELIRNGENTVEGGYHLCRAAQNLLKFSEPFFSEGPQNFIPDNYKTEPDFNNSLTQKLDNNQKYLEDGLKEIKKANKNFQGITEAGIPDNFQGSIFAIRDKLPQIEESFESIDDNFSLLLDALGHNGTRHYLILFQNNAEMRATGGFIGSYAILKIHKGKVRKFFVDNIYNPDGILKIKVEVPKPLKRAVGRWKMRDANWSPDFPTSAQKVGWFHEKEGGGSVDGIIAITPTLIEDLLKITGPVKMEEYGTVLTNKNFTKTTQVKVEKDYTNEENPKEFLIDFAPRLLTKLVEQKKNWFKFLNIISQNKNEKHLLAFSYHPQEEDLILKSDLGGEIKESQDSKVDYLSVINSNLTGNKSSAAMKETIKSTTEIQKNGEIIRTVIVVRKHTEANYFRAGINNDYMRVLVPEGSTLIESKGNKEPIEISAEKGKTVFGTWVKTHQGKTSRVTLKYKLPFKLKPGIFKPVQKYILYLQKQSGSKGSGFEGTVRVDKSFKLEQTYPDSSQEQSTLFYKGKLITDKKMIALIKK